MPRSFNLDPNLWRRGGRRRSPLTAKEWTAVVADVAAFITGLDRRSGIVRDPWRVGWLHVPTVDDVSLLFPPLPSDVKELRRKLEGGLPLSESDRAQALFLIRDPAPGRRALHPLSRQSRDGGLALCAVAAREFHELTLYRRSGGGVRAADCRSACDAVAAALKHLRAGGSKVPLLGYSSVRTAVRQHKQRAEVEFTFLVRNMEAEQRRREQVQRLIEAVGALPPEAFGEEG